MGWSKKKTTSILTFMLLFSLTFALLSISLMVYNLRKREENNQYWQSFTYILATTFGTGLGCIWFRICQAKKISSHALIHSISLVCMFFGHREIFDLLLDGEIAKCYNMYPISMLTIAIYFILTFHFILFRHGKTPRQRAFNSGLHAFIGAITLFVCITDGLVVCHKISRDENLQDSITFHWAAICLFFYGMTVWFLILNPYFDWRRLSHMLQRRSSKVSFS
ncbi:uncharacterized protein LOC129911051 isoform X2 [Episyrphus balteatus]|uniref:uncharacterized protein LOC129911051 isoform X2 n=1 Tax=Episyrphus balteatus TaxID=286459 RepID=UPI002486A977|nr:uncharacterized protein LOC129911051 isoform X2 [Episyrphus balteatus]